MTNQEFEQLMETYNGIAARLEAIEDQLDELEALVRENAVRIYNEQPEVDLYDGAEVGMDYYGSVG